MLSITLFHGESAEHGFCVSEEFIIIIESAIDNRPPSNIGRACVTTKEAKPKIITASER